MMTDAEKYRLMRDAAFRARTVLAGLMDAPIGSAAASIVLAHKLLDDAITAADRKK